MTLKSAVIRNTSSAQLILSKEKFRPALVNDETLWLKNFISRATQRSYSAAFREFCGFHAITRSDAFRSVTPADVTVYRQFLIDEKGMSNRSVRSRLAALSSCYKFLFRAGKVSRNPVELIERPRVDNTRGETPVMTKAQVRHFLAQPDTDTLKGTRDSAILHLLLYTGARIGSPRSITVGDFFEDQGFYVLRWKKKGGENQIEAVPPELQYALQHYLSMSDHGHDKKAPLFLRVKGQRFNIPLSVETYEQIWHNYRHSAGLPPQFTPHSARATFATTADEAGVPIQDIQKTLGHKRVSTTQAYIHSHRHHKDSAVFKVKY